MAKKGRNRVVFLLARFALGVFLLAAAGAIFAALYHTRPQPARSDDAGRARRVVVMKSAAVDVRRQWDGFGTARAMDTADVPARVTATVIEIPPEVQDGAPVEAGALLVRLDDADFVQQVELAANRVSDATAQLERLDIESKSWEDRTKLAADRVRLARAEFDRVVAAQKREAANPREVDLAEQTLIAAIRDEVTTREEFDKLGPRRASLEAQRRVFEAERRLAALRAERCRITSPIAGIIQSIDVEVGENLQAGQRVARVVDLGRLEVPLRLPASARAGVRLGDEVAVRVNDESGRAWRARVVRIAPENDATTRTMGVFIEIAQDPDAEGLLAPGQFLRGTVTARASEPRSVVPRRAVDGSRILLVRDGVIVTRAIEIAYQVEGDLDELALPDRQWVVLAEPLPDDALVVLNPSRSLPDGLAAEPVIANGDARTLRAGPAVNTPRGGS